MKLSLPLVIALTVFIHSAPAPADSFPLECSEPIDEQATVEAKAQFAQGAALFEQGDYQQAIELWSAAYTKDCSAHALLLNLATAHHLEGELAEAISALRRFNSRKPKSPYVKSNFKRILKLEDQAKRQDNQRRQLSTVTQQLQAARAVVPPPCDAPETSTQTVLSAALTGGGLLTALAGGAILFQGRTNESKAHQACAGDRSRCTDFAAVLSGENARSQIQLGAMLALAGVAVTGVGTLWYWLAPGLPTPHSAERPTSAGHAVPLSWHATVAADGMRLGLEGRF